MRMSRQRRHRIEALIDGLVALLDEFDDDADAEPSLGSGTSINQALWGYCGTDDREFDPAESGIADHDGMQEQLGM